MLRHREELSCAAGLLLPERSVEAVQLREKGSHGNELEVQLPWRSRKPKLGSRCCGDARSKVEHHSASKFHDDSLDLDIKGLGVADRKGVFGGLTLTGFVQHGYGVP